MSRNYRPADLDDDDDLDNYEFSYVASNSGIEKTSKSLSIKIIPEIGHQAGLNNTKFDVSLGDTKPWFDALLKTWQTCKRTPRLSATLQQFYISTYNPFLMAIKMYANCTDYSKPQNNGLSFAIFDELSKFKRLNKPDTQTLLNLNLKMVAFNLTCDKKQSSFFKLIVDIYELVVCNELFVDKIKEMCQRHEYKEANQIAVDLELYNEFDIYAFLLPLFFQDKHTVAEMYLDRAVHLQEQVLGLLDSFIDDDKTLSVINRCSPIITQLNIPDVKYDKLDNKPLTKLITRLANKYSVPSSVTPHVNKKRNRGNLYFWLHKYYVDRSQNESSWEEMVKETVNHSDEDLQIDLICSCADYNDVKEAVKWVKYFNIDFQRLPVLVQDYLNNGPDQASDDFNSPTYHGRNGYSGSSSTHRLKLSNKHIHLVDTKSEFDKMLKDLERQSIVALDSEWKPTQNVHNTAALLQLATHRNIYLIDLIMLQMSDRDWERLGTSVFNNDNILKLGFAPSTDIIILQKTLPAMNIVYNMHTSTSVLDLQDVWKAVQTIDNFRFPYKDTSTHQDLSTLVQLCLGKRLDKSNQLSNWMNRPLRSDQINYAALDAYCLLEIYDVIEQELYQINIDFNHLLNDLLMNKRHHRASGSSSSSSGRRKDKQYRRGDDYRDNYGHGQTMQPPPDGPNRRPVKVDQVRFVCDGMLGGLARILRRFGIDTMAVGSNEMHDSCVHVARTENRFILTRGRLYEKLSQYVPNGHCYKVLTDSVHEQLFEVLRYYKINVVEENVLSRCQICNSSDFTTLTQAERRRLLQEELSLEGVSLEETPAALPAVKTWNLKKFDSRRRHDLKDLFVEVPPNVADEISIFYICDGCQKVYWDGKHLDDILNGKTKTVLHMFE